MSWETVFMPSASWLELFIRGTVMYLAVFAIMRIAGRRESGELNMSDLILIVIISEAASVGIGGEATSIFDSIILVATIVVWSIVLDWASYHSRFVEKLVKPRPKPLIRDGILDKRVARKEFLTIEELQSQLRLNGMTDISEVAVARIEPNGEISFIQRNRQ